MNRHPSGLLEYVKSVADGRFNKEIAEMASSHFGIEISSKQIGWLKTKNKITSRANKRTKIGSRIFTKEQVEFINNRQYDLSRKELSDLLNKTFGLSTTVKQIKGYCERNGLTNKFSGRFTKGQEPWCKGTKGVCKANIGSFQVGSGKEKSSIRLMSDGSVLIKISDRPHSRYANWRPKHELVWEKYHKRRVPDNHIVIFLDGNKSNFNINNLELISRGESLKMNQYHYRDKNPEITKAGIGLIRLDKKIKEIENSEV